jgi:hypothetical protein
MMARLRFPTADELADTDVLIRYTGDAVARTCMPGAGKRPVDSFNTSIDRR